MKKAQKILSMFLTLALLLSCAVTASAAGVFGDIPAGSYYEEAAEYAFENHLISGTGSNQFSPNMNLSRGMLATILWRNEGQPSASASDFTDVKSGSYYETAIGWAAKSGIVDGYGNNRFGPDDAIQRQQLATMLYRYAEFQGEDMTVSTPQAFADDGKISNYAKTSVAWAREKGIITGKGGNRFDPTGTATRAEGTAMVYRYLTMDQADGPNGGEENPGGNDTPAPPAPTPTEETKVLVAYFSCTNNTEGIAQKIQAAVGENADLYEITPTDPYTSADLNYSNNGCRANQEQNNDDSRPAISGTVSNMDEYDVVFIGYPIWWGKAPRIIQTFLESYNLSGKTIVPFCTSGSSGYADSTLKSSAGDGIAWITGRRFPGGADQNTMTAWVNGLNLPD